MTLLAPRIVLDVSYVPRINHEIHFAWQAQYLMKLDCHRSAKCCIFPYKMRLQDERSKVSEAAGSR